MWSRDPGVMIIHIALSTIASSAVGFHDHTVPTVHSSLLGFKYNLCHSTLSGLWNMQRISARRGMTTLFKICMLAAIMWVVAADSRPGAPDFERWQDMFNNASGSGGSGKSVPKSSLDISPITHASKVILGLVHTHNTLNSNM